MYGRDDREETDECFRLAVEATPNAMIMSNQEGKIILVNSCAETLFGYKRQELLGQPIEILLTEASRRGHPDIRQNFLGEPRARPWGIGRDLHAQRKDGTQFPVEIGLNPIKTAEGTWILSSIVNLTFDRQKLESIGVLAGGIAHDFNNFLGSILSDADLALTELSSGSSPLRRDSENQDGRYSCCGDCSPVDDLCSTGESSSRVGRYIVADGRNGRAYQGLCLETWLSEA